MMFVNTDSPDIENTPRIAQSIVSNADFHELETIHHKLVKSMLDYLYWDTCKETNHHAITKLIKSLDTIVTLADYRYNEVVTIKAKIYKEMDRARKKTLRERRASIEQANRKLNCEINLAKYLELRATGMFEYGWKPQEEEQNGKQIEE
jgi:hypothetical protein